MKYKFPRVASDIFPFRPIPGTEDYDTAVKLGYQPPRTLEEWGACLEYKYEIDDIAPARSTCPDLEALRRRLDFLRRPGDGRLAARCAESCAGSRAGA